MGIYQRLLGHPFVFDVIRPLYIGGLDWSPFYARLGATAEDVVVDIGCGTGEALRYLSSFRTYVGFDTDATAITAARKKHANRDHVTFISAICTERDIERLEPTRIALCGLLHHLPDNEALALLDLVQKSPSLRRIATADTVYLEGELISNTLARLDRGRYCRDQYGYHSLVAHSGLRLIESAVVRCHPKRGLAKYLMMTIEP